MQKRALRCLIGYARRRQGQSQLRLVGLVDSAAANLATNLSGVGKGCLVLSSDPFAELTAKPCGRSPEWPLEHVLSEGERSCSVIATYYGAGRVVGSGAVTPRQIMITILKNRRLSRQMLKSRSHSVIGIGLVTRFSGKQQTRYWAIYTAKGCAGATISDLGGLPELWSRS